MSYSCCDFMDDVLGILEANGVIDSTKCDVEDRERVSAVLDALTAALEQRTALINTARDVVTRWDQGDLAEAVRELANNLPEDDE